MRPDRPWRDLGTRGDLRSPDRVGRAHGIGGTGRETCPAALRRKAMKRYLLSMLLLLLPAVALAQDTCAPEMVTSLSAALIGRNSVVLHFTAPHSDCSSGGAVAEYAVRYSTSTITEQNFWLANAASDVPGTPASPGSTECADVVTLTQGTTYYAALK